MGSKPSDRPSPESVAQLTGERDLARAECRAMEHLVTVLVDERARLIGQLAGNPITPPVRPMFPRAEFLLHPERALQLAQRHGSVLLVDERGAVCGVLSRPDASGEACKPTK